MFSWSLSATALLDGIIIKIRSEDLNGLVAQVQCRPKALVFVYNYLPQKLLQSFIL